jgi:thiol-disulfide isomerase/thioredoxin
MSLTTKKSPDGQPIAKVTESKTVVYLLPDDENQQFYEIPDVNVRSVEYKCPYCRKLQSSKQQLIYHMNNTCKGNFHSDKMPVMVFDRPIQHIPSSKREVIFISGIPGCGKSYWMNQYVDFYKKMYKNNPVILFTTHEHDESIDESKYVKVLLSETLADEPFELKDLANSLVIFDDIDSSKYPTVTKYLLSLMDDIARNGRHHNIYLIYINQSCRLGHQTKNILTMLTHLVVFPNSGESYQCEHLLKEYCGMSKQRIKKIMSMSTRTLLFSRAKPQYIQTDNAIYILGKEIYADSKKMSKPIIYEQL